MEIRTAKTAGFCFGVERAVSKAEQIARSFCGPVYSFGPIVHNETVIKELEKEIYKKVGEEFNINSPKQLG